MINIRNIDRVKDVGGVVQTIRLHLLDKMGANIPAAGRDRCYWCALAEAVVNCPENSPLIIDDVLMDFIRRVYGNFAD